jgi:hypothetical protein
MFKSLFFSNQQAKEPDKPVEKEAEKEVEKEVYRFEDRPPGLCDICLTINFKEILQDPKRVPGCDKDGKEGKFIAHLGSMKDMRLRGCRLCTFWADCAVKDFEDYMQLAGRFELRAFSLSSHNLEFKDYIQILKFDSVFLWVVDVNVQTMSFATLQKNGFIMSTSRLNQNEFQLVHGREKPSHIDFSLPLSWMKYCSANHAKSCGNTSKYSSGASEPLPEISVINCEETLKTGTLQIVKREPEDHFAVLSYVWGQSSTRRQTLGLINGEVESNPQFHHLPKVIQDAIIATSKIEMRYLWVDRYCLDTRNSELRHTTIMKMHLIYSAAEVAIIVAAGKDDEYGIPGVQQTPRRVQSICKVNEDLTLVSTMKAPTVSIEESVWATRAWTLQEGTLPRRRLVFTNEQLYFECQQIHCREAVCTPMEVFDLPDIEPSKKKQVSDVNAYGYFAKNFPWRNGKPAIPLYDVSINMIMQYTKRTMSYESDSLNALLGILHSMSLEIGHIWGLPIDLRRLEDIKSSFVRSLTWFHPLPNRTIEPVRRANFPSWSWVGWQKEVAFHNLAVTDYQTIAPDSIKTLTFSVELKDGSTRSITDIISHQNSLQDAEMNLTNVLTIRTYGFIPESIKSYPFGNTQYRMWFILNGVRGSPAEVRLSVSSKTQNQLLDDICTKKCLLLFTGIDSDDHALFLIVELKGKVGERIGLMRVRKFETIGSNMASRSYATYRLV